MKKDLRKTLSGAASAAMLISGCASQVAPVSAAAETASDLVVTENEATLAYSQVSHVQGSFTFDQEALTPADEVFNLFGTVVTGMCAKPSYALETYKTEFLINVGGKLAKPYTVNLKEQASQQRILLCSCATGAATANANITGVRLADVLSLAEISQDVNTVTVKGSDGYGLSLPLSYALEKEAMIVYKVNDKDLPSGTQFWVPETVAKYFTRDVVDIELSAQAEAPAVDQRAEELRAEVAIMNYVEGERFQVNKPITFEGYADDCGDAIQAVEFSLDDGETWTAFATQDATPERWVYWHFDYVPTQAGSYKLSVRARTQSGLVSPLAANVVFTVESPTMKAGL